MEILASIVLIISGINILYKITQYCSRLKMVFHCLKGKIDESTLIGWKIRRRFAWMCLNGKYEDFRQESRKPRFAVMDYYNGR